VFDIDMSWAWTTGCGPAAVKCQWPDVFNFR